MNPLPLVHVVGHQCPDTDAVVSAVMAARLLARTRPEADYTPLMQGGFPGAMGTARVKNIASGSKADLILPDD